MTNITFKNGKPIFLAEDGAPGLVAANSSCCCPPPPPPGCWCPDWCLYKIEILSPVAFSPRPTAPCNEVYESTNRQVILEEGLYGVCEDGSVCCGPFSSPQNSDGGNLDHYAEASVVVPFASFFYRSNLEATAYASVNFRCSNDFDPGVTYADVVFSIAVPRPSFLASGIYRTLTKTSSFQIASTCSLRTGATCDLAQSVRFGFLDVPLEFSVSAASAGLGAWDESNTFDISDGDQDRVTRCFDHLVDNFEVTFRITARESCAIVPRCCCGPNSVTVVDPEELCDGTTSAIQDPPIDLEDITIVVDWDGLTLTLDSPYFSGSASEGVSFSCDRPVDEDPFDITERNFTANFFPQSSDGCVWFSSNINAFFINTTTGQGAQSNQIGPYVGECKLNAPVDATDTSCEFGESDFWCSDHPYANSVAVEMIIAP